MGLTPLEVKKLTLKDYQLISLGYARRTEIQLNHTRHIMWSVINFGGMGLVDKVSPEQIWPLSMDKEGKKKMITTIAMAIKLLKEFEAV